MSLFFIYLLMCLFIYILFFFYLFICSKNNEDNHISGSIFLLLLYVFLLGNNQFLESDCKLDFDIMYTHAFFILRTVTLPVHYDSFVGMLPGHDVAV